MNCHEIFDLSLKIRDAFGVESVLIELRAAVTVGKTSYYKTLHFLSLESSNWFWNITWYQVSQLRPFNLETVPCSPYCLELITADLSKQLNSSHFFDGHVKCSFNLTSVTNEDKDLYPIRGHPLSTSKEYSGFWISFPFPYTHATSLTRAVLYPNPLSMEILNGCPLNRAAIEEQHHNQDGSQAK